MPSGDFLRRHVIGMAYLSATPEELVRLVQRDDNADAFLVLMTKLYPFVVRSIRRVLQPPEPIEDIANETFTLLWESRVSVAPESVAEWLKQTSFQLASKTVRSSITARKHQGRIARGGDDNDPQWTAEQREMFERIQLAIQELSHCDQRVIQAAGTCESDEQAATELGIGVSTYRTQLHRARQRLRTVLQRYGFGPLGAILATASSLFGKLVKSILGKLMLTGAVAGIGWWYWSSSEPSQLPPQLRTQMAINNVRPVEDERFRNEIIPEMMEHLKKATLGKAGNVRLLDANRNATRYEVRFGCVHRDIEDGKVIFAHSTELRFRMHIATRAIRIELFETGKPIRCLNPSDTIVLGPTNLFGISLVKSNDLSWPGLLEATRALQRLGVQDDVAITGAIHELRRTMYGRDATSGELVDLTRDLRDRGWLLRSHAEWSTNSHEFHEMFIRPCTPRQAAFNYVEKLYAPGTFTNEHFDELEKLFVPGPDGTTNFGPASIYISKLKPRSRWAEVSLEE